MTERLRGEGIFSRLARHEQLAVGARFGHRGAAQQGHYVSGHLPHGELSQIRDACSGRGEKELCITHTLMQSGEIGRLSRARYHNVDFLISVRAKALGEAVRGNDVVFRKHHDERDSGRAVRSRPSLCWF
jgi:hypothetical protein